MPRSRNAALNRNHFMVAVTAFPVQQFRCSAIPLFAAPSVIPSSGASGAFPSRERPFTPRCGARLPQAHHPATGVLRWHCWSTTPRLRIPLGTPSFADAAQQLAAATSSSCAPKSPASPCDSEVLQAQGDANRDGARWFESPIVHATQLLHQIGWCLVAVPVRTLKLNCRVLMTVGIGRCDGRHE